MLIWPAMKPPMINSSSQLGTFDGTAKTIPYNLLCYWDYDNENIILDFFYSSRPWYSDIWQLYQPIMWLIVYANKITVCFNFSNFEMSLLSGIQVISYLHPIIFFQHFPLCSNDGASSSSIAYKFLKVFQLHVIFTKP